MGRHQLTLALQMRGQYPDLLQSSVLYFAFKGANDYLLDSLQLSAKKCATGVCFLLQPYVEFLWLCFLLLFFFFSVFFSFFFFFQAIQLVWLIDLSLQILKDIPRMTSLAHLFQEKPVQEVSTWW